jgi:uncharacterized repeat protein (TIGR01451 family)
VQDTTINTGTIFSTPSVGLQTTNVVTQKYLDKTLIGQTGEIQYTLQVKNIGDTDTSDVYIIDPLPV